MNFETYLSETAKDVEQATNEILDGWRKSVEQTHPALVQLANAFIASCQGGKRLRGMLVRLGYELTAGEFNTEALKAAAAFEIFHAAILAHDDVIDKSPMRRGKPSLFQALGGDHYGISQTISLGDIGFFLAVNTVAGSNYPAGRKNEALKIFTDCMIDTGVGELLDVVLPHEEELPSENDVLTVMRLKTAKYSISSPLKVGAVLAGADDRLLQVLGEFGENVGIAYQIQDDILGIFGTEEDLGKSVTSDIEEGKNTLLYLYALDKANEEQKKVLNKHYGRGKVLLTEVEKIKEVFEKTGAVEYANFVGKGYLQKGEALIPEITKDPGLQILLKEMIEFLVERKK
ncbi:MAG: polyprenyl synthetase family protein [Candidatus Levybacteria bacterium]|nr:polyprenyl synthetase family protein [Candidatus Levybacteria bacterium]